MCVQVRFIKLEPEAKPFTYAHENDACMDIYSLRDFYLRTGRTYKVPTGIAIQLPIGYAGRVIGRSGLSSEGLLVSHGVVDEGYRGPIHVIITNTSHDSYQIKKGDRIAQFSVHKAHRIDLQEVDEFIGESERGVGGFGSTGK